MSGAIRESTFISGISMGGYGASRLLSADPISLPRWLRFSRCSSRGFTTRRSAARNRLHHMVGGPRELLVPNRDAVFEANNPANRARAGADAIKKSGLAIYLEVGDEDFLNAHDGTEFLHRVLWDLDIAHEYRLIRGADHGGPTLVPRFAMRSRGSGSVSAQLQQADAPAPSPDERAVSEWIERGLSGDPPPVDPGSDAFIRILRAQLKPLRDQAARIDPNTPRRYCKLPKTD